MLDPILKKQRRRLKRITKFDNLAPFDEIKDMSKAKKKREVDSLRNIAESYKTKNILHGLYDRVSEDSMDKLLDVLADIDLIENYPTRQRIKKLCYAIVRSIDREDTREKE